MQGKEEEEFEKIKLDILGLTEPKLKRQKITELKRLVTFLYSGV